MKIAFAIIAIALSALLLAGCAGQASNQANSAPGTGQVKQTSTQSVETTGTAVQPTAGNAAQQPSGTGVQPSGSVAQQPSGTVVQPSAGNAAQQPSDVKEIIMTAKRFAFDPQGITVKKGQKVRLHITVPDGDTAHGYAVAELGVNANLPPGKTTTVEFTPEKAGTFTSFCSVMCGEGHRDMRGTITVEE